MTDMSPDTSEPSAERPDSPTIDMNLWHWFWTGESKPRKPGTYLHTSLETGVTSEVLVGWRYCSMCRKYLPPEAPCNYDWSGTCSAGDFIWQRDALPVRNYKGVLVAEAERLFGPLK